MSASDPGEAQRSGARAPLRAAWGHGVDDGSPISRPPTRAQKLADRLFRGLSKAFAALVLVLVAFIVLRIALAAAPAMREQGFGFLSGHVWDPNKGRYAILPEIWGTLYTSGLALVLGTAFGVAAAVFLSEGYLSQAVYRLLRRSTSSCRPGGRGCQTRSRRRSRTSWSCSRRSPASCTACGGSSS